MMMGARVGAWKKLTEKDYVQNSLVVLFDGIESDRTSGTWIDSKSGFITGPIGESYL